jgi:outer membrane biosynthesis protein TonB
MPRLASSLLAIALCAAAIALSSCGEEDAQLLPGGTAREITANLDTVGVLADEGDCVGAESAALQVSEQVEAIEGVDERLKRALREGAARLNEVVAECEEEVETVPDVTTPEPEPEPLDDADEEKEEKKKEKQKQKDEDDAEGDEEGQGAEEEAEEVEETEPTLPPQAEGGGEGSGNGNGQGGEGGGSPSGGVAPASPAGEGG